jgi:hypothetical protein
LVAVALTAAAARLALLFPSVRQSLLHRLADPALARAQLTLAVGDAELSLGNGELFLKSLRLSKIGCENAPPLLEAGAVTVHFDWRSVLWGAPKLREVRIERAILSLRRDEKGQWNFPVTSGNQEWTNPLEAIQSALVTDLSLRYADSSNQVSVEWPDLEVRASSKTYGGPHVVELKSVRPGVARVGQQESPLDGLDARATLARDGFSVEMLTLRYGNSRVEFTGRHLESNTKVFQASLKADVDLLDLPKHLLANPKVRGKVGIETRLSRDGEVWLVESELKTAGVQPFWPEPVEVESRLRVDLASGRTWVEKVRANTLGAVMEANGNIGFGAETGENVASLDLRGLSASRLFTALHRKAAFESAIQAHAKVRWKGSDWKGARAELRAELDAGKRNDGITPLAGVLQANAAGSGLSAKILSLETGGFALTGDFAVSSDGSVTGRFHGSAEDLGQSMQRLANIPGSDFEGPVGFDAQLSGALKAPVVNVEATGEGLRFRTLEGLRLAAEARLYNGHLEIGKFDLSKDQTELRAKGTIDLSAEDPGLNLTGVLRQAAVRDLERLAGLELVLGGALSAEVVAAGSLRVPKLTLDLRGEGLEAYGQSIGSLSGRLRFDDGTLSSDGLTFVRVQEGPPEKLELAGQWNTRQGNYSIRAESTDVRISKLDLPAGQVSGVFRLKAEGQGQLENPALTVEASGRDVVLGDRPLGTVQLRADAKDQRANWALHAPDMLAEAKGSIGMKAPFPADASVELSGSRINVIPENGPAEPLSIELYASGSAAGELDHAKDGTAALLLRQITLRQSGRSVEGKGKVQINYHKGVLAASPSVMAFEAGRIEFSGSMPIEGAPAAEPLPEPVPEPLHVRADIEIGKLRDMIPQLKELEGRGALRLEASIGGSVSVPRINGTAALLDGHLKLPGLESPLGVRRR